MLCSLGVSNFYILGGVLLITLLARRAFCGYMCPVGTLSEWLRSVGRFARLPELRVPRSVDRVLGLLKYPLLLVILYATWRASELVFRGFDPCYALISRHGADISFWAYVVAGAVAAVSLVTVMPFCRWFCPLAAVLSPFSRLGLARVKRDQQSCRDCGLCSRECPMAIPVHALSQVTESRCISCLNCLDACPQRKSSSLVWGPPRWLGRAWSQAALVAILLACTTGAVAAAYLVPLPSYVKSRGERPERTAAVGLKVDNLSCRGRANLLFWFLERDDMYALSGYVKLEAWPGPGFAAVRVTYDPSQADEQAVKRAITEPYFNLGEDFWRASPFTIEGYDMLELGLDLDSLPADLGIGVPAADPAQ
jgi:ferredoxin